MSVSGVTGPFRAFPKSLSVDFGGLNHPQQQSLPQSLSQPQQQQSVSVSQTPAVNSSSSQDKYAALSQLDSVFTETSPAAGMPCLSCLTRACLHFAQEDETQREMQFDRPKAAELWIKTALKNFKGIYYLIIKTSF